MSPPQTVTYRIPAFDTAVVSDPPFEAVIHAASPYHFNAKSREQVEELVETAHKGTVGILEAVKAHAPGVKRVVVTSSFAAIVDPKKLSGYTYSEKDWCPITREESFNDPASAYRFSKTQAEKAAWEFVDKEKPHFTLTTVCPVQVYCSVPPLTSAVQPASHLWPHNSPPDKSRQHQHQQHPTSRYDNGCAEVQAESYRQLFLG